MAHGVARLLKVHIPIFTLSRIEDGSGFVISGEVVGDPNDPSAFGPGGGAILEYESPGLTRTRHADVLVPLP